MTAPVKQAGLGDAGRIADLVMAMIRAHASLKTQVTGGGLESDFGQLAVLMKLAKGGPTRASTLADQICADPSTVSRQVAALVRGGLLERRSDPGDGRASLLALTHEGWAKVGEFADTRAHAIEPLIGDWSADDREIFIELLERYVGALERNRDTVIERISGALHQPAVATVAAVAPSERQVS